MKAIIYDVSKNKLASVDINESMTIGELKEKIKDLEGIKRWAWSCFNCWKENWGINFQVKFDLLTQYGKEVFTKDDYKMSMYLELVGGSEVPFIILPRMGGLIPKSKDNENRNKLNDSSESDNYYWW